MKDCFFTFGGRIFWEDLFVKHGWRIQRNLTSRKFRLLDSFDIVRFEGSFKKAVKEFEKYSKAYELEEISNSKKLVILLHGYAQSGKIFKKMSAYLGVKGFDAQTVEYPSTQRGIIANAQQLNIVLDNLSDHYKEISFITYGIGNIILEKALQQRSSKSNDIEVNKIIEIAPATGEDFVSELQKIIQSRIFKFILGDIPSCMKRKSLETFHCVPQASIGVIKSKVRRSIKFLPSFLLTKTNRLTDEEIKKWRGAKELQNLNLRKTDLLKSKHAYEAIYNFEIKKWCGAKELLNLNTPNLLKSRYVFEKVCNFLNYGKFK